MFPIRYGTAWYGVNSNEERNEKKKKKIGENVAITPNSYSPSAESRIWLSRGEQSKHVTY